MPLPLILVGAAILAGGAVVSRTPGPFPSPFPGSLLGPLLDTRVTAAIEADELKAKRTHDDEEEPLSGRDL